MRDIEQDWQDALENGVDETDPDRHELFEDLDLWQSYESSYQACKKALDTLYGNRKSYFDTNFHKIARRILRELEAAKVTCLVLSRDVLKAKNGCSMGRVGNQRFTSIPFKILVDALKLYGLEDGIEVIDDLDEAYSSKTNCQKGDMVRARTELAGRPKQETRELRATVFQGRRHKSSFKCLQTGKIWHADLNGAVNIVRIYLCKEGLRDDLEVPSYKLCSPQHLKGEELFNWLDTPYRKAA